MADTVDVLLRLRGSRQFQSEADRSAKSIGRVGTSAEDSGKKARAGWKGVAKWAGGAAAFAGVAKFAKDSAKSTMDLGKTTMALSRQTGMSAETASEWGTVLKARGVDSKQFGVGMTKLSKTMVKAGTDGKTFASTFKTLGIAQDTVRGGDINSVLLQSADAFSKMTNPAEKAAMAQQLFGKQAQNLLPLMSGGSEGIKEQLDLADKYGATMSTKTVGGVKELVAQQREMKIASEGLKITFGTALLPVILEVVQAFASLVRIFQPILRDGTVMKVLLGALVTSFIALKIATIASTIATLGFNAAFLLIPLAIIAVVAGIVILYKKVGWFRNAVDAVFSWLKTAVTDTVQWITTAFGNVVRFIKGLPGKISSAAKGMWDGIKDAFRAALNWLIRAWNGLQFTMPEINTHIPGVGKVGGFTIGVPDIPLLAAGGSVTRAGAAVVGEAGPEIITLPRGANVIPMPQVATVGAPPPLDGGPAQTIITKVYLNGREIAQAVGRHVADERARR